MHTFKKGDRVAVINQTFSGTFIVEGMAKIVAPVRGLDEQYRIKFEGRGLGDEKAERFVDPNAQTDPKAFCQRLNETTFTAR